MSCFGQREGWVGCAIEAFAPSGCSARWLAALSRRVVITAAYADSCAAQPHLCAVLPGNAAAGHTKDMGQPWWAAACRKRKPRAASGASGHAQPRGAGRAAGSGGTAVLCRGPWAVSVRHMRACAVHRPPQTRTLHGACAMPPQQPPPSEWRTFSALPAPEAQLPSATPPPPRNILGQRLAIDDRGHCQRRLGDEGNGRMGEDAVHFNELHWYAQPWPPAGGLRRCPMPGLRTGRRPRPRQIRQDCWDRRQRLTASPTKAPTPELVSRPPTSIAQGRLNGRVPQPPSPFFIAIMDTRLGRHCPWQPPGLDLCAQLEPMQCLRPCRHTDDCSSLSLSP